VRKLISIGVVLALLTMAVVPVGVGAQPPEGCPEIDYTYPQTFAKIPFAIIQSGLEMLSGALGPIADTLGIPEWLFDVLETIAPWAGGPLAWTVDMMGWALWVVGQILGPLAPTLGLPTWLTDVVNTLVCGIFTPYTCVVGPNMTLDCT